MYLQNGVVVVMGDFNAHLQGKFFIKPSYDRGRYLSDMMESLYLSLIGLPSCSGGFASFVSYDDAYASLLDHVLLAVERLDTVIACKILDDHVLNESRPRSIVCSISVPLIDCINIPHTFYRLLSVTNSTQIFCSQLDMSVVICCHLTLLTRYPFLRNT